MNIINDVIPLLPWHLTGEAFISVLAGLAALAVVAAIWSAFLVSDPMAAKARQLSKRRSELKKGLMSPKGHANRHRVNAMTFMQRTVERLQLAKSEQARKMALGLSRAGWRSKDALTVYLFTKFTLPFILGGAVAGVLYGTPLFPMQAALKLTLASLAVVLGAYLPDILVKNHAQKRQQALQKGLPDALDLLVICAEAGLAMDAALNRVARESAKSAPEIADELLLTAIELGFLPDRRQALDNLDQRTQLPSIRGVVSTLIQTEKYGTPLAQSLRVLSAEFRNERMMKAEEKAAKLPATLTLPLVMFVLPTLFVVLLGPAILRAIDGFGGL